MASFMERIKASWDLFTSGKDGEVSSVRLNDLRGSDSFGYTYNVALQNAQAVVAPLLNRIAIDASVLPIKHVKVDELDRYLLDVNSELNDRLTLAANIDQTGRAFIHDAVFRMLSHGAVVLVPVETSADIFGEPFDILSFRAATVVEWFNRAVRVSVYNEITGQVVEITLPKSRVAIAYNPFYAVMNKPNGTLQRLIQKLSLLDLSENELYSPKLDLILQLPYTLKTDKRVEEAVKRVEALEEQLYQRKYGIAYIDSTEKVHQLNRPVTSNLWESTQALKNELYNQLGITQNIFAGTSSEEELILYHNRTVLPVLQSLADALTITFFSRTAIRQGHRVRVFLNLFKMAPLQTIADSADKLTRNEIFSPNEVRQFLGQRPDDNPKSDELRNRNMPAVDTESATNTEKTPSEETTNE